MSETIDKPAYRSNKLVHRSSTVCDMLDIRIGTFWKLVKEGKLETRKLGGLTVVPAESLKRFVEGLPSA